MYNVLKTITKLLLAVILPIAVRSAGCSSKPADSNTVLQFLVEKKTNKPYVFFNNTLLSLSSIQSSSHSTV